MVRGWAIFVPMAYTPILHNEEQIENLPIYSNLYVDWELMGGKSFKFEVE